MYYVTRQGAAAAVVLSMGVMVVALDATSPAFGAMVPTAALFEARNLYVANTGNDLHTGGPTDPLRTIQRAVNLARAGDTIVVKKGVYLERVIMRYSGLEGMPIRLMGEPGERPIIQPTLSGTLPTRQAILLQAVEGYRTPIGWITIERLELRGGYDGMKYYNAHDVEMRDCRIVDSWNQGMIGTANRFTVDRTVITGSGASNPASTLYHGIYATGSSYTITNNLIHSNAAYGIQVAGKPYDPNVMAGPEYSGAKDWVISNNVFAYNRMRCGVVLWQAGVENCLIQNNIFFRNGAENGIRFYSQGGKRHRLRRNIFYPAGTYLSGAEPDSYVEEGTMQINPKFLSAGYFDFRLQSTSRAIDAGTPEFAPPWDHVGRSRPQGPGIDIGAYERAQ